jgi:hypothetical protein
MSGCICCVVEFWILFCLPYLANVRDCLPYGRTGRPDRLGAETWTSASGTECVYKLFLASIIIPHCRQIVLVSLIIGFYAFGRLRKRDLYTLHDSYVLLDMISYHV